MITLSTQGAVAILGVDSTLEADLGAELAEKVSELPRGGRTQLILDMSACPLLDSQGCEALLDVNEAIAERDGVVHFAALTPLCSDILVATGVDRFFKSFPSVREGVISFAK